MAAAAMMNFVVYMVVVWIDADNNRASIGGLMLEMMFLMME